MSADADVNVSPITMNMNMNGLDNIGADVDLGLDDIRLHVDKVEADVKAGLTLDEIKATLKIDEIKAALQADFKADLQASLKELAPIIFSFLWKEIPLVRVSSPHRYRLGLQLCGREVFALTFCGESEVISEKNPCGERTLEPAGRLKPEVAAAPEMKRSSTARDPRGGDHG
jgi:hypothetical protein